MSFLPHLEDFIHLQIIEIHDTAAGYFGSIMGVVPLDYDHVLDTICKLNSFLKENICPVIHPRDTVVSSSQGRIIWLHNKVFKTIQASEMEYMVQVGCSDNFQILRFRNISPYSRL